MPHRRISDEPGRTEGSPAEGWTRYRDGPVSRIVVLVVLAPLLVGASIAATDGLRTAYLVAAALAVLPLLALRGRTSPANPHHEVGHGIPDGSRTLVVIGAAFYVAYIGIEAGFAGWIYTFAEDRGLTGATATLLGAAFLGTFAVGRLASIPIAMRIDPRRVLFVDHAIVFVGLALLLVSGRRGALIWSGTVILGLGLASLFGTMLTLSERHMPSTSTVTSIYFGGLSLGGIDRKSTRLNSSHVALSRMPSSA